jgi:hypothetical protein
MKKSLIALAAMAAAGCAVASSRSRFDAPRGMELRALDAGGLLANIDSATLNKNTFMQGFGDGSHIDGKIALAVNPTAADVVRIMRIPAGNKVSAIMLANDDLDSNGTPTIVFSLGYAPVVAADGPAASARTSPPPARRSCSRPARAPGTATSTPSRSTRTCT